jgi:hypothetical protein
MAYMPSNVYFSVVLPTLITGAAFIGITTLGQRTNYVDEVIEAKADDGEAIIHHVDIKEICDRCERMKKTCLHYKGYQPEWHDEGALDNIQKLMVGQEAAFKLEMQVSGGSIPGEKKRQSFARDGDERSGSHRHAFVHDGRCD